MADFVRIGAAALLGLFIAAGCTVEVYEGPTSTGTPSAAPVAPRPVAPQHVEPPPPPPNVDTTVPTLSGLSLDKATRQINLVGLRLGHVTKEISLKPSRIVLRQSPDPGRSVRLGSPVHLVISHYDPFVTVPNCVNQPLASVQRELERIGLRMGRQTFEPRAGVRTRGTVVGLHPRVGSRVRIGSTIDVVVAIALPPVPVPLLANQRSAGCATIVARVGLRIGKVIEEPHGTIARGIVIRTEPPAGTRLLPGSAITLIVSEGSPFVAAPSLIGTTREQAAHTLAAAGLRLGTVRTRLQRGPPDIVISQTPAAGAECTLGDAVSIMVSRQLVIMATVPNLVGFPVDDAVTHLRNAGFRPTLEAVAGTQIKPGNVIHTDPPGGRRVVRGSRVAVHYAKRPRPAPAPAPHTDAPVRPRLPQMRNFVGMTLAQARAILARDRILHIQTHYYASTKATGTIINQSPVPGRRIHPKTQVIFTLARSAPAPKPAPNAPTPRPRQDVRPPASSPAARVRSAARTPAAAFTVVVPKLVGMTRQQATIALSAKGLILGSVRQIPVPTAKATGLVVSQTVQPGTTVARGARISIGISAAIRHFKGSQSR